MNNYFGYAFTSYAGNLGYFPQYPREFNYPKGSSQWQTIHGPDERDHLLLQQHQDRRHHRRNQQYDALG